MSKVNTTHATGQRAFHEPDSSQKHFFNVPNENDTKQLAEHGISADLRADCSCLVRKIAFNGVLKHLYVSTHEEHGSTYAAWFENDGGTVEFDIRDGELMMVDSHGCNFGFHDGELTFCPHKNDPNNPRLVKAGRTDVPLTSTELMIDVLNGGDGNGTPRRH